jgi:hypothetical protein
MHDKDLLRQQQLSERGRWTVLCVPDVAEVVNSEVLKLALAVTDS